MKWSAEDLDRVVSVLGSCRVQSQALAMIRADLGENVSWNAVDHCLRRARGFSAFSCLGKAASGRPPPYESGPASKPPVYIVDDEVPPTDRQPILPPAPRDTEVVLFVPDTHWPFADRAAWQVMLNCARVLRPSTVVVLGDFLDFFQLSDHDKDPRRITSLSDDVSQANEALDQLDALGASRRHYVSGNHEFRLQRYLWKRAPALVGLEGNTVQGFLNLAARGWSFTEYRDHMRIGDVWVTHETGHAGQWAHHRSSSDFMGSTVIGHTHRIGTVGFGNALGEAFTAAMFGWLGSMPDADYMHNAKKARDWAHGFGVGYLAPGRPMDLHAIRIVNRAANVHGSLIGL